MSAPRITRSMHLVLRRARSCGATRPGAALSPRPRWPRMSSMLARTIIAYMRSTRSISLPKKNRNEISPLLTALFQSSYCNCREEMNSMSRRTDKCKQLRELQDRLTDELRALKESVQEAEEEGVANPIEMVTIIKSLQKALSTVELELQKCPDTD